MALTNPVSCSKEDLLSDISESIYLIDELISKVGIVVDAVEVAKGIKGIKTEDAIKEFEKNDKPKFKKKKDEVYAAVNKVLGMII